MRTTVGTFNLNNLFSRFNFQGAIDTIQQGSGTAGGLTIRYEFTDAYSYRLRTFLGRLVRAKDPTDTRRIADRINAYDVDVLAVQEVENIDILRKFNRDYLGTRYDFQVLIEGNDARFIDVGILSKLPIGAVTTYQNAVHSADPSQPVFSRDLLEVEIWNRQRTEKLFTLYNNHLKSHYVPPDQDPLQGAAAANQRRQRQAEKIAEIVEARMRPNSRYIILGDMNDPPDSQWLNPLITARSLALTNALANPQETRAPKQERLGLGPQTAMWTYRHKETKEPPEFFLYDHIWISPSLSLKQTEAFIDRRTRHSGDGSDHDLAWIELDL
jgi:endonuclease/exonuclease/phosphatase family metal-dependent hydrolase